MFFSPKSPRGDEPEFCQGLWQWFYIWYNCIHILTKFEKKTMDGSNVIRQKVTFLATLRHFGAFPAIKEPLRTQRDLFSKIQETISPHIKLSMQNTMDSHWEFSGCTHGRTGVNSKVPVPTKVGGPIYFVTKLQENPTENGQVVQFQVLKHLFWVQRHGNPLNRRTYQ